MFWSALTSIRSIRDGPRKWRPRRGRPTACSASSAASSGVPARKRRRISFERCSIVCVWRGGAVGDEPGGSVFVTDFFLVAASIRRGAKGGEERHRQCVNENRRKKLAQDAVPNQSRPRWTRHGGRTPRKATCLLVRKVNPVHRRPAEDTSAAGRKAFQPVARLRKVITR